MLKKKAGVTLYEQVVDQIKSMVAQGVYQKGDMLPSEKELMQLTGVSRITVREALKTLAEVGLIETRQGKGSFVRVDAAALQPDIDTAEKQAAYRERFLTSNRARLALEPELARLAALHATDEDIRHLESLLVHGGAANLQENAFDEFHHAVAKASGNPLLLEFLDSLLQLESENRPLFLLTLPEDQKHASAVLKRQHENICNAIRDRDGEFAYFYMKEHTTYLLRSYEEFFKRFC